MPLVSREIRLQSRPAGLPAADNFSLASVTLPDPGPGEIQVRNSWMSVDPYMRGRMRDVVSYVPPFQVGKALEGGAIGTVVQSNAEGFRPGDTVMTMLGWREAFNVSPANVPPMTLRKIDTGGLAPELFLGIAGLTGMTAWVGLLEVAKLKAGDVVFVSAAAGAVGSAVCQIAKLKGATVIGSAGGAEKCAYLRGLGVDQVIDYKAEANLTAALAEAAPAGIDVYFENVGGAHLEAALAIARPFARFAICGMIGNYNGPEAPVAGLWHIIAKRLRLEGFIVSDHFAAMPSFLGEMIPWIASGKITSSQTVEQGIERAPDAFLKLFRGENLGKMLVKLD